MAHAQDGHGSNVKRIWMVFGILSVVTIFEVWLGIWRPEALYMNNFIGMNLLNWVFIILTLYKAYKITWVFMHMEGEKVSMRWAVVSTVIFLALYLLFILLVEADYVFEVFKNATIKWNF